MNENIKLEVKDDLIRRALQLEIESVEPPAADKMWRGIEARLAATPALFKENRPVWIRYAGLAAAACLLLVFSAFGLIQIVQFASPASEYDAAAEYQAIDQEERSAEPDFAEPEVSDEPLATAAVPEAGPDAMAEQQKDEPGSIAAVGLDEKPADQQTTDAALPPVEERATLPWPEILGTEHFFSEEIVLPPAEDEPIRVALYSGPENDLLLVCSGTVMEDPRAFVEKISQQMQFPLKDLQYRDGYLFFVAGGYKGLVFQYDGLYRAIMAPPSIIKEEQLIELAAPFR